MWQKRESEWEKERRARERLMQEVGTFQLGLINDLIKNVNSGINKYHP